MPSSGDAGMPRWLRDQTTQRTCALASRRQKYQCPLRWRLKSLTSPRTHIGGSAPSITAFAVSVSDATGIAFSGDAPGIEATFTGASAGIAASDVALDAPNRSKFAAGPALRDVGHERRRG